MPTAAFPSSERPANPEGTVRGRSAWAGRSADPEGTVSGQARLGRTVSGQARLGRTVS